jgi:hypothetical protein
MNENEIVYILINEAMPGYIKIGITTDLKARLKQLSSTSVPVPFECFFAKRVKNAKAIENKIHAAFAKDRVDSGAGREFFIIPPEQAAAALSLADGEEVQIDSVTTDQEKVAIAEIKSRRPIFNFSLVNINPGSVLQFYLDESITCTVFDSRKVEFNGKIVSLSDAAMQVLESKNLHWKAVSGPGIWMFEGETLHERRLRMEAE